MNHHNHHNYYNHIYWYSTTDTANWCVGSLALSPVCVAPPCRATSSEMVGDEGLQAVQDTRQGGERRSRTSQPLILCVSGMAWYHFACSSRCTSLAMTPGVETMLIRAGRLPSGARFELCSLDLGGMRVFSGLHPPPDFVCTPCTYYNSLLSLKRCTH